MTVDFCTLRQTSSVEMGDNMSNGFIDTMWVRHKEKRIEPLYCRAQVGSGSSGSVHCLKKKGETFPLSALLFFLSFTLPPSTHSCTDCSAYKNESSGEGKAVWYTCSASACIADIVTQDIHFTKLYQKTKVDSWRTSFAKDAEEVWWHDPPTQSSQMLSWQGMHIGYYVMKSNNHAWNRVVQRSLNNWSQNGEWLHRCGWSAKKKKRILFRHKDLYL